MQARIDFLLLMFQNVYLRTDFFLQNMRSVGNSDFKNLYISLRSFCALV